MENSRNPVAGKNVRVQGVIFLPGLQNIKLRGKNMEALPTWLIP
jgi:hypothetical protein